MSSTTPDFPAVATALGAAGVPFVVLRGQPRHRDAAYAFNDRKVEILVRPQHVDVARRVVEPMTWRYAWVRTGALRLLPMAYYWWDGGTDVSLLWGLPASPLPSLSLRGLAELLWRHSSRAPEGYLEPDPTVLLVHLAVQSCRPGHGHDDDWRHFLKLASSIDDWERVEALARRAGVSAAVRRCRAAADAGADRPGVGALYDGPLGLVWRASTALQSRARPRRLRRLLTGMPSLGDLTIRCRLAGVEVTAEPGVFVPTPDADLLVALAAERLEGTSKPIVVEVGTGCGAIALALAAGRADADVRAIELDPVAVRSARRNARRLRLERVRVYGGSLLDPLPPDLHGRVDVIVANLPYYPARDYASIGSVPRGTILGVGEDGLDLVRQLARAAGAFLRADGRLVLQMFAWQWESLGPELVALGYRPGSPSLTGRFAIGAADRVGGMADARR